MAKKIKNDFQVSILYGRLNALTDQNEARQCHAPHARWTYGSRFIAARADNRNRVSVKRSRASTETRRVTLTRFVLVG